MVLCFLYGLKDILIQPLVANVAVIAFDVRVLLGLVRLDVLMLNVALLGPAHLARYGPPFLRKFSDNFTNPFTHRTLQNLLAIFCDPLDVKSVVKSRVRS